MLTESGQHIVVVPVSRHKGIQSGSSLPVFLSPSVLNYLDENLVIKHAKMPGADLADKLEWLFPRYDCNIDWVMSLFSIAQALLLLCTA